ncbi:hypothetical protein EVAR_100100_1 [Eumeta japonica]|uniref:Uncharacterized protein n=1 Tax=Eumeta variegata TaxID=151549 RepID=A0A4C1YSM3_EUMVA|nr:hypothetical protein EVAR_100100_1 [Eumeta japonica]
MFAAGALRRARRAPPKQVIGRDVVSATIRYEAIVYTMRSALKSYSTPFLPLISIIVLLAKNSSIAILICVSLYASCATFCHGTLDLSTTSGIANGIKTRESSRKNGSGPGPRVAKSTSTPYKYLAVRGAEGRAAPRAADGAAGGNYEDQQNRPAADFYLINNFH